MSIESNLSRQGKNNGAGQDRELFIKRTQTDVLAYFRSKTIFEGLVTVQSIDHGKSKAFPIVGKARAKYHSPGEKLEGEEIVSTEREITIDKMLVAHTYIPEIDQLMSHYDAKSAYNQEIGRALAERYDQDIARMLVIAGKVENSSDAGDQGLRAFKDDVYTNAQFLEDNDPKGRGHAIFQLVKKARVEWNKKKVMGEPCIVLASEYYYDVLDNPANAGATWISDPLRQSGQVPAILGCPIYESPNMPQSDDTANSDLEDKYKADFRGTVGVMFSKEAIGVLKMMDINIETNYIPTRLADLMTGKLLVGLGILNHACAIAFLSEELKNTVRIVNHVFSGFDPSGEASSSIEVVFEFDETVLVTGTPKFFLFTKAAGKSAVELSYTGGTGSKFLTFEATISDASHDSAKGDLMAASSIDLNGGSIKNAESEDAVLEVGPMDLSEYSIAN